MSNFVLAVLFLFFYCFCCTNIQPQEGSKEKLSGQTGGEKSLTG